MLKEVGAVPPAFEDEVCFFITCVRHEASTQNRVVEVPAFFLGGLREDFHLGDDDFFPYGRRPCR